MTRRDFFLLVLILLIGAGLHVVQKVREGHLPLGIQVEGLDFLQGPLHSFSETREAPLPEGGTVEIEAGLGSVEVLAWDQPRVAVEVHKQLHAGSEKEAAGIAGQFHLKLDPSERGVRVEVVTEQGTGDGHDVETDFTLTVPRKARLHITSRRGNVEVHGVEGDTVIQTAHGDVNAGELGGACEITNRHGAVRVTGVRGNLKVTNEHDDVTVTGAAAGVEIDASRGTVSVDDSLGEVRIRDSQGEVNVKGAGGNVSVDASHCNVTIQTAAGAVTATVAADPLEVSDVGGQVTVQADATSVRLSDVRGKIHVTGRHTDVTLIRPGSDVEVETTHQAIELSVPAGRGFRLAATSDRGEIESLIPALHLPGEPVSTFSGTVGDGRSRYQLTTSHSTIRISQEPQPATP